LPSPPPERSNSPSGLITRESILLFKVLSKVPSGNDHNLITLSQLPEASDRLSELIAREPMELV
jgi:hypothetical protein